MTKQKDKKMEAKELQAKELERINLSFSPAADIYQDGDDVVIKVDMPGVAKQDISLNVENGLLKIQGTIRQSAFSTYRLILQEYREGNYNRSFRLSDEIDIENIKANYDKGVLTLTLPKAEKAKTKQITVE